MSLIATKTITMSSFYYCKCLFLLFQCVTDNIIQNYNDIGHRSRMHSEYDLTCIGRLS